MMVSKMFITLIKYHLIPPEKHDIQQQFFKSLTNGIFFLLLSYLFLFKFLFLF